MFGILKRTYFVGSVEMVAMEAILYSLSSELKSPSYSLAGSSFNTKGVFFFLDKSLLYIWIQLVQSLQPTCACGLIYG